MREELFPSKDLSENPKTFECRAIEEKMLERSKSLAVVFFLSSTNDPRLLPTELLYSLLTFVLSIVNLQRLVVITIFGDAGPDWPQRSK